MNPVTPIVYPAIRHFIHLSIHQTIHPPILLPSVSHPSIIHPSIFFPSVILPSSSHPFIHLPTIDLLIHPSVHYPSISLPSFHPYSIHLSTFPYIFPLIYPCVHPAIHPAINAFFQSIFCQFNYLSKLLPSIDSFIHLSIHPFIDPFICPSLHLHTFIHPSIHFSVFLPHLMLPFCRRLQLHHRTLVVPALHQYHQHQAPPGKTMHINVNVMFPRGAVKWFILLGVKVSFNSKKKENRKTTCLLLLGWENIVHIDLIWVGGHGTVGSVCVYVGGLRKSSIIQFDSDLWIHRCCSPGGACD